MRSTLLCVALALLSLAAAAAAREKPHWLRAQRANPTEVVRLLFAVKQRNLDELTRLATAVSDPQSPSYGQYQSREAISDLVADATHYAAVAQHLRACGVSVDGPAGGADFLSAAMTVRDAERCFPGHDLHVWTHPTDPQHRPIIRSHKALEQAHKNVNALPHALAAHVDVVTGLTDLPPLFLNRKRASASASADGLSARVSAMAKAGGPNAPQWVNLLCSDTAVYFQFEPMCKDGSAAGGDFCQSNPPAIQKFTIRTTPQGGQPNYTDVGCTNFALKSELKNELKTDGSNEFGAGDGIVCAENAPVLPFEMYTFSLITVYADNTVSGESDIDTPWLTTPFVSTQISDEFYGVNRQQTGGLTTGSSAVVQWNHNYMDPDMLSQFEQYMQLPNQPINIIGPNDPTNPEGEANQDAQWIIGVAQGINATFWSVVNATVGDNAFVLEWQYQVDAANDVPLVYSISYGESEKDTVHDYGQGYAQRCEVEFQKMALRGLTVVIADGDSGVSGGDDCGTSFNPDWPGSSAWVTSASASGISSYQGDSVIVSVKTGFAFTTGGGFSTFFSQPTYQKQAVSSYLSAAKAQGKLPPTSYFPVGGRAYPDVSTLGSGLLTFYDGQGWLNPFPGGGTSFSAPIMAGLLAMLNAQRINTGRAVLGFANPWLYQTAAQHPDAFYDITIGENSCSSGDLSQCCTYGFQCITGFDVPSGLGSPNFNVLLSLV